MELTQPIPFPDLTMATNQAGAAGADGAAQAANREARFAALVHRQSRFVFQVAYSVLRNAHDAEDVVQDTFLKLHRTAAWETIEDERAFLARTAWRLAVDLTRRRTPKPAPEPITPSHEQATLEADLRATLHCMIDALPDDLRQPLALSAIEELTSPQIAAILGIPEGTVRTRILRARRLLKEKLAAHMESRHA